MAAAVVFTASRVRRFPVRSRFHKSAPPEWPLLKKAFIEMPSSRRRPSLIVVCLARHFPARDMGSFVSSLAPFSSPAPPSRRYRGNNGGAIITAAAHDKEGSSRPRLASFLSALVGRPLIGLKVYRNGCRNGYCCPLPWNRRRLGGPTMAIGRKALVFFALGGREDGGGSRQRFVVVVVVVVLSLRSSPSTNRRVLMHGPTFAR